jgi:hypothetical protein
MKSWIANLVGVGVGGATLAVGFLIGTPEAAADAPANPAVIGAPAAPDDANGEVSLGDSMQLNGRPTRLSMFWTPDETDEIVRVYSEAWKKAGFIPQVRTLDRVTSVTIVENETGLMRSVTISDAGDQRMVTPSVSDIRQFPDSSPRTAPVPVPENAQMYLSQVADDANAVSYHATFLMPNSPAQAVEFYKIEMGKLGYAEHDAIVKSTKKAQTAEFHRGPEVVTVIATQTEDSSEYTAFVVVEHVRAVAPEGP